MLNLVPFAGTRRHMTDSNGELNFVGQFLEFNFPKSDTIPIATTGIGHHKEARRHGIDGVTKFLIPGTDGLDGKFCRIMTDTDTDPGFIFGQVIDAIGNGFAYLFVGKVMHQNEFRVALGAQLLSGILIGADQFLFLRVYRNRRISCLQLAADRFIDMLELGVAVRMLGAFQLLFVALTAVAQFAQQFGQGMLAHLIAFVRQGPHQIPLATSRPQQRRFRVSSSCRLNQFIQSWQQVGIFFQQLLRPPPRCRIRAGAKVGPSPDSDLLTFLQATTDCHLGHARRSADCRNPAVAEGEGFASGKQAPTALGEGPSQTFISDPNLRFGCFLAPPSSWFVS